MTVHVPLIVQPPGMVKMPLLPAFAPLTRIPDATASLSANEMAKDCLSPKNPIPFNCPLVAVDGRSVTKMSARKELEPVVHLLRVHLCNYCQPPSGHPKLIAASRRSL